MSYPNKGDVMAIRGPLVDGLGRIHSDLRLSVTDRCNIRCFYCMPAENVVFLPRKHLLTFEEMERFARVAAALGIRKLRLTGGEPLVRRDLPVLIRKLAEIPGIQDIALTTNGILLADQAQALKDAGLKRLNISLDVLSEEKFLQVTRREGLDRVLQGVFAAKELGFDKIKLNAVAVRGLTEEEVEPFGRFAREHDLEVRFIEYMPLDADGQWDNSDVLSGDEILRILTETIGPLERVPVADPSQPSTDYGFTDGKGRVGFINPITQPFCGSCNRLRLTAEGKIRNCLFALDEWDARELLRKDASDDDLADLIRDCVQHKKPGHGVNSDEFIKPDRAMYQIGG
ncbi:MAG: GTP 3',8-cyclase MoaA [Planctomycetales bacterium]